MIITSAIFALAAFQRLDAFDQPLCFWVLCLLAVESVMTLLIGGLLAWKHPDCLLSEKYQQSIREMEASQKTTLQDSDSGHRSDSSEESDGDEEGALI